VAFVLYYQMQKKDESFIHNRQLNKM